ncbi:MAG: hypothetical protein AB8C13_00970 [Phycisphaerales bacterium]
MVPSQNCHHCSYDMHNRRAGDQCPECATTFDTRPDAYTSRFKLNYPIVLSCIGLAVMPFVAIFAFIFLLPTIYVCHKCRVTPTGFRVPSWAAKRLEINKYLLSIAIAEFCLMLIIHTIWPQAFNWW